MNREIKFRGRKNSTGEWIYGSLVSDLNGGYAIIQMRDNPISYGAANGWCFGIEKGTEGQYTGLHDKNGTEIYEGDIVSDGSTNGKVFYNTDVAQFQVDFSPYEECAQEMMGLESWAIVIGNIHEHPELLK